MHLTEDLLRRYFENRCTRDEERFVEEALQRDDAAIPGLLEGYWDIFSSGVHVPHNIGSRSATDLQPAGR